MPKKKPEMSQIYSHNTNEFVFGEHGGKGKNLSSFLKNLSLTGSPSSSSSSRSSRSSSRTPAPHETVGSSQDTIRKINSSIYGNLSYGYDSPDHGGSALTAMSMSTSSRTLSSDSARPSPPVRSASSGSAINIAATLGRATLVSEPPAGPGIFRPPSRAVSASADTHRSPFRRPKYADLDDDWDADFSDMGDLRPASSGADKNGAVADPALASLDGFHPDSTTSSLAHPASKTVSDASEARTHPTGPVSATPASNRLQTRLSKFTKVLADDAGAVNIQELRKLSWNGIPPGLRALTWQLLLGYLPTNKTRQRAILSRKRQEYVEGISKYSAQFDDQGPNKSGATSSSSPSGATSSSLQDSNNRDNSANKEKQLFHQINIDVKRTNQTLKLYGHAATQTSLKKILFLWAIRHPASGYVQGINDICTPFYQIFLNNYLWQLQRKHAHEFSGALDESALFIPGLLEDNGSDTHEKEIYNDPSLHKLSWENFDPARLSPRVTAIIEADSYWCISRLLDNITDNYIHEQPGIIKQVNDLQNLISKIDAPLVQHLQHEGVEFIQFSFRWMNCLLMREVSIDLVIRMWDTYLSETPLGYSGFHIYVCAAFLIKFSSDLKEKDFQDILLFLQNPPTASWTEKDIELMLSEAFIWQSLYKNAGARSR